MKILGLVEDTPCLSERPKGIGRCYLCGRARNKSTRKTRERCYKWVCPDHLKYICIGICIVVMKNCVKNHHKLFQINKNVFFFTIKSFKL